MRIQALEKRLADNSAATSLSTSGGTDNKKETLSPSPSSVALSAVRRPSETSLVSLGTNYGAGLAPALEKMQAVMSQREGEITSLQEQLGRVERERSALAEELVALTTKVTQLCVLLVVDLTLMVPSFRQAEVSVSQALRGELAALKQRHSAALDLLGEKEEKLEELKADLVDMKQLYRSQITEMVEKNAQLTQQVEEFKKTVR